MILKITSIKNPNSSRFLSSFTVVAGTETSTSHGAITYTAGSLASASVSNEVQSAGTLNKMTFTFQISNSIPQNGIIFITFPSQVQFKKSPSESVVTVSIYGVTQTGYTATPTSRSIEITNLFSSAELAVQANDIVITMEDLNNPESQITSNSFEYYTLDSSSNEVDKTTTGLTIQSTSPGVITLGSISPSSIIVDNEITVQFFETTDISPSNAFLRVYWPSEVTYVTSGTLVCDMVFGFTPNIPPCVVDTTNRYMQLSTYTSTSHLFSIGTFRNPLGAVTTSTWQLIVYDNSNNIIMQKTSDITYTTVTSTISVTSSIRPTSSTTVGIRADYNIVFVPTSRMLSDSKIKIIFPVDQVKYDGTTACYNGATNLGCTITDVDASFFQVEITQWCNTGAECTAGSTINFTLKDALNPSWVTSPLSSTVQIFTINTQLTGNPTIDEITTGVQFSPSLTPGTLTDISVAKDAATNKVGEQTSYIISFTVVTEVQAGGQVKLTFPSEAVYKASSTAVVCTDTSTSTAKTCTSTADANNNVSSLTITNACNAG